MPISMHRGALAASVPHYGHGWSVTAGGLPGISGISEVSDRVAVKLLLNLLEPRLRC